jgi:hypothetical protein
MANTLTYSSRASVTEGRRLLTLMLRVNVIKLFSFVFDTLVNKLEGLDLTC